MLDMLTFGRDQAVRIALVFALLAGVTAAAFGLGYRSSDAVLGDGSAYVQKGHTVVHVNAESGKADAEAARDLATGKQRLEVVQVRPGDVYVVNNATGEVWRLPTDTMVPARVETPSPPVKAELISGGGKAYLHDAERGTLALLDGQKTITVPLSVRADAVVVDNSGTAWVLSKADGMLYEIRDAAVHGSQTVAIPGEAARLTLTSNRPVVFLPERGTESIIRVIGKDAEHPQMVVGSQPDGALQVARPSGGANVLVTMSQRDDTVYTFDLASGEHAQLKLEGRSGPRSYGRPVIAQDHLYIPDFTRRQIIVLLLKPLRQLRTVPVPGKEPFFDVFERDGRVWVNDPYARTLLTFNRDKWSEPDKGDGRGVVDAVSSPTPSASPSRSPSSSPSATASVKSSPKPRASTAPPPPPRRVSVPQVAGLTAAEACNRITTAELTCLPPVTRQETGCETGKVIGSTPGAGSLVSPRSQVTITVCGATTVPGPLAGMPIDQACQTVEAAGLACARRDGGPAPSPAQVNTVSAQNPAAGTQVGNRSTVEVAYFTSVTVPQVTGMAPAQACATLQAQGLGCAPNAEEITWEANVVHGQSIAPGTAVPLGAAVGYVYQDTAPLLLNRWKLAGEEARFLSVGGSPPGGHTWQPQPPIGGAYPPSAAVPGLVNVYQFVCTSCGGGRRPTGYWYNQSPNPPTGNWTRQGHAFSCFGGAQPGTRPLLAMYHSGQVAWAFAPEGSGEYNGHYAAGYRPNFTICHIWFGVPGLP